LKVLGLTLLALTVPVLAAGGFAGDLATASALRWGLAACFVACSAVVWLRDPLARLSARLGISAELATGTSGFVRGLLVAGAGAVAPVLILTAVVAMVRFTGQRPSGPAGDSFFVHMGNSASNFFPLLLVSVGLVGHAVRERSPGYAFGAGLVANAALMGGYVL